MIVKFLAVVVVLLCGTQVGCIVQPPAPDAAPPAQELVVQIERKTVAFVKSLDGEVVPYCAGVWVGQREVLTALHCIVDENQLLVTVDRGGDKMSGPVFRGTLLKGDLRTDLALVETNTSENHPVARVSHLTPRPGDQIHIVGHTIGYPWSYTPGAVAAVRHGEQGPRSMNLTTLQVSAFVWFGNSGGGAWNVTGELVGISSWVSARAPGIAFFVSPGEIRNFLANNEKK